MAERTGGGAPSYWDDFPLCVAAGTLDGEDFPQHGHAASEIVLIHGGRAVHAVGPTRYPIGEGDVLVVHEEQRHAFLRPRKLSLTNMRFDRRRLLVPHARLSRLPGYHALFTLEPDYEKPDGARARLRLAPPQRARVTEWVRSLQRELNAKERGFTAMAEAQFLQLVVYLSRLYEEAEKTDGRLMDGMAEVLSYMQSHFAEPQELDALAARAHMSTNSFLRAFRKAVGSPPIAHIVRLRIWESGRLLRETDLNVTEIAHAVGFADSNYFAKQFRKLVGLSPRGYRKLHR